MINFLGQASKYSVHNDRFRNRRKYLPVVAVLQSNAQEYSIWHAAWCLSGGLGNSIDTPRYMAVHGGTWGRRSRCLSFHTSQLTTTLSFLSSQTVTLVKGKQRE